MVEAPQKLLKLAQNVAPSLQRSTSSDSCAMAALEGGGDGMAELEGQMHSAALLESAAAAEGGADGDGLDDFGRDAVRSAAAAAEGGAVLVVILVGACGAGKSATANSLTETQDRSARRSAAAVTRSCGVSSAAALVVLDTPGFGDPAVPANATVVAIRRAAEAVEDEVARCGKSARFATLFLSSIASRFGETDVAALEALSFALGRAWRNQALLVWTHADLLEEQTHGDFLEGLEDELRSAVDSLKGGHALLDNTATGPKRVAMRSDILERATRFAREGRPQPRGKHARRIRQDAMLRRQAAARDRARAASGGSDEAPGRCAIA